MLPTRFATGCSRWSVVVLALVLATTGCAPVEQAAPPKSCGRVSIAVNPWVGYRANAAVVTYLATTRLGCEVSVKELSEQESWEGLAAGDVDVILENWGHEDLKARYARDTVVVGTTGNVGAIGWYVPPWMKAAHPDITDWRNLPRYRDLFATIDSGGQGQLLDGDPSFVTHDEALIRNLGLDYRVVHAGSEPALIKAFQQAEEQHKPLLGYFFEPQWLHLDLELVKVDLPPHQPGCDADPATVACDYPRYELDKIARRGFADAGGPA
ncbi:MAG: glycine betaine ABC transporter substrate-binding protein, partial [Umezawaea sp.]